MNIRIYSHQKNDTNMIRTNIRTGKYSNIFEYPNIRHTLTNFVNTITLGQEERPDSNSYISSLDHLF